MNDLATIIRDNLKWHARALVAADQRGQKERAEELAFAAVSACAAVGVKIARFSLDHVIPAANERRATRGL